MSNKQAYIVLTNKCTQDILQLYKDISNATFESGKTYLCYHSTDGNIPSEVSAINNFVFNDAILSNLNCRPIKNKLLPGSNHFPILDFYLNNQNFDYYWVIEDDVRFNGQWNDFFNVFNSAEEQYDFTTCHVRKFLEEPGWHWWESLKHDFNFIPFHLRLRSFNPIYRISNKALEYIYQLLANKKWSGHHEVLLPTMLSLGGFSIADFGGEGSFVNSANLNKYYTESTSNYAGILSIGTMRFRPTIADVEERNKLHHPVKVIDWDGLVVADSKLK